MKAVEAKFLDFLSGLKQYIVPIYQRTYSWRAAQCEQLWRDVKRVADDPSAKAHFVGSVVYIQQGLYQSASVPRLLVIDGQQRLTTLTLLLLALARALEARGESTPINPRKITDYYLFNPLESGEQQFKLQLTKGDRETLNRLLQRKPPLEGHSKRLLDNYAFFEGKLSESGVDLERVFEGLHKLMLVDIALDRAHDNPQLIFESLNSTGLDLTQADLIRNYVLMGLEPRDQDELYNEFWFPMERAFGAGDQNVFDRFMRDYLTLKTRVIPRLDRVYETFKAFHRAYISGGGIRELVEEISRYAGVYARFNQPDLEPDKDVRRALEDLRELKVEVAFPLLLEVFDDAGTGLLSHQDLIAALRFVESYVFRRSVCGLAGNGLNKVFPALTVGLDKNNYLESFGARLLRQKGLFRFPLDDEFSSHFGVWKAYYNARAAYYLRRLENFERKEPVDLREFATIEHILPQTENLSKTWQAMLGTDWQTIHAEWVHTVGNLTLTGYNAKLSDRPFLEKRDIEGGFADSPLRLNADLRLLDHWDGDQIRERGKRLASKALRVWPQPTVSEDSLAQTESSMPDSELFARHFADASEQLEVLYNDLEAAFMALETGAAAIAYQTKIALRIDGVSVADVQTQPASDRLRLWFNMPFEEFSDPHGLLTKPKTGSTNKWATCYLTPIDGVTAAIELMQQVIRWQSSDADDDSREESDDA